MLIKIKTNNKTQVSTLYFEAVYCKVNYNKNTKVLTSIDIKRENGAEKENIIVTGKELWINTERVK
ncbi:hypothetical protein [Fusobacterium gastrosuis]|uniref:hypothetical protein n=1 Tax=Fusobacterium gastrosuis TaxID=1755100 RepID=UPI002973BB9F|nr:hypothetical protein [Fusobacteriaceae bacterium]MDY5714087.1 hypothetical protein [Fusobacterium gastrosuis]